MLTWVIPITFMIAMSWTCESDARRFGQPVLTRYGEEGADNVLAIASTDRKAGGNKAITVVRGVLVVLSVAVPLALIASTVMAGGCPLHLDIPRSVGALAALSLVIAVSIAAIRG